MPFFASRAVNLLNLHYLIAQGAVAGGGAFYAIWMLKAGIALPLVLLAVAVVFAVRFLLRLMILPLAIRLGLKPMVIAGTLLMALVYLALWGVDGLDRSLGRLVLVSAVADVFYWPCYHAYFAALGEAEHRGRQLSVREASAALIGIVAPLAFAALLLRFGAGAAFTVTALVQAAAALPLFFTPQVEVARRAPEAWRAGLDGAGLFVADGLIQSGFGLVWQLALFLTLNGQVLAYGGAMAGAALAGAVGSVILGRWLDAGKGLRAVALAMGAMAAMVVMRAAVPGHPLLAVMATALGALASCLYTPTLMTAMYNLAKRSPDAMRFHLTAEAGWDGGAILGLVAGAALLRLGAGLGLTLLLPLVGLGLGAQLLRAYFGRTS